MSDSNLTPSPSERPQNLRVPVTRLVQTPQNKPEARLVPPEEPPAEPWEEDLSNEDRPDQSASLRIPSANGPAAAARQTPVIQMPRPVNTSRPAYGQPARTNTSPGASNLSAFSRPIPRPAEKANLSSATPVQTGPAAGKPAAESPARENPAPQGPFRVNLAQTEAVESSAGQASSAAERKTYPAQPAPAARISLGGKSVQPVSPTQSGIKVIATPARIVSPAPRMDLPEPVRVPAGTEGDEEPEGIIPPQPIKEPQPVQLAAPARALTPAISTENIPAAAAPIARPAPAAAAASIPPSIPSTPLPVPDLPALMEGLGNLPAQTAILGVCDDRLPVLIDLADPAPGALMVASDDEGLRTRLLRTLLQTGAALNSPHSVQFLILSTHPAEWQVWLEGIDAARHCLGIDSLLDGNPDRWLLKLSGWADQRRTGSSNGPAVILVVDDLTAVPKMEYDARVNFDWLVKEGPGVRIWPVGALAVEEAPDLARWVRLFKTRILGPAIDPALYRQLAAVDEAEGAALVGESQFAVQIEENWLKFRIPGQPGDES